MSLVETPSRPMDQFALRWSGYGLAALGTVLGALILFVGQAMAQALTLAAIAVQIGLLAMIERSPEAFMVTPRRSTRRVINFVLIIPVVALAMPGADARFVRPEIGALAAVAAAAVGMLVAVWAPRSVKVENPIIFGLFVGCYAAGLGWGAVGVNRVFDPSIGQVFQTTVSHKSMSWAGRGGPHYYVTVEPWGPVDHPVDASVGSRIYGQVSAGSPICPRLHPGALGAAWYQIDAC